MSKGRPPPIPHRLVVPKGYENAPAVLQALAALQNRYGKEHVELVVEEGQVADHRTAYESPDLTPRRVVRVPPDSDE
jgi:hypothetical protein